MSRSRSGRSIFLRRKHPAIEWSQANILDFLTASAPMSYDCVTMFHVLEHIPYPKRMVEAIAGVLRPNGIVVIEVPDAEGWIARLKGARWEYYLDHHVNYFGVRSLTRLLGQFGFHIRYLELTYHFSYPQGVLWKDAVKGMLARLGLNANIRSVWSRA